MTTHWTTLLNDFQKAVKEKKYSKVPYDHWREMKQRDCWVTYTRNMATQEVKVIFEVWGSEKEEEFFTLDYPFGQFLWDQCEEYYKNSELAAPLEKLKDSFSLVADKTKDVSLSFSTALAGCNANNSIMRFDDNLCSSWQSSIYSELVSKEHLDEIIDEALGNSINNGKENNNMNLFKGFDFGSCANDSVKVSMYGIAVKNANGTWVSYDAANGNIVDVDILNFDGKYLYKMPVAIKDVKAGDTVIHNRKPMFVSRVEGGKILAIDPAAGEEKVIMLTKSMFGFDFVTKVVNLFSDFMGGATADAPFGNILPLMMLADGNKSDDMLPLMLMMNGGKFDTSNPMMLYFLMKDNKSGNDMLPLFLMSNFNGNKCICNCECNCDCEG